MVSAVPARAFRGGRVLGPNFFRFGGLVLLGEGRRCGSGFEDVGDSLQVPLVAIIRRANLTRFLLQIRVLDFDQDQQIAVVVGRV